MIGINNLFGEIVTECIDRLILFLIAKGTGISLYACFCTGGQGLNLAGDPCMSLRLCCRANRAGLGVVGFAVGCVNPSVCACCGNRKISVCCGGVAVSVHEFCAAKRTSVVSHYAGRSAGCRNFCNSFKAVCAKLAVFLTADFADRFLLTGGCSAGVCAGCGNCYVSKCCFGGTVCVGEQLAADRALPILTVTGNGAGCGTCFMMRKGMSGKFAGFKGFCTLFAANGAGIIIGCFCRAGSFRSKILCVG